MTTAERLYAQPLHPYTQALLASIPRLADDERDVMVQMATLDFIIPNEFTEKLVEIAKVPQVNYIAEHGFIVLPFEPAYLLGVQHLSRFLSGDYQP